ncbi:MAG: MarR family transcriptional regulator [Candidatus Aminicenantes bacterium]|nr:MarR family transcriptional regulator [Candidatus Aminicenantes bacterium]
MNYKERLTRVSSQIMTLTGFFHGVIRMDPAMPAETRTNLVRYHILKCLERRGPHHLTEISTTLAVKKNTLSELLDRMVRDDLVDRAHAPDDRRMTILGITPAGRTAIREFEKALMTNIVEFLETLREDDRRDLVRAMESLIRILARHEHKSSKYFPF